MHVSAMVLTVLAAAAALGAAAIDVLRVDWVQANMDAYGVPRSWLTPLALIKAVGGVGLLIGLAVPAIGIAAAVGLVAYFLGALATVIRARMRTHIGYPMPYLALAGASLALQLAAK